MLHRSLNEALFSLSSVSWKLVSLQSGQTDKYLTKLSQREEGAPNPASLRHLFNFGKKSFFIDKVVQASGKLFDNVKSASLQRVVYKIVFDSPTRENTFGPIIGMCCFTTSAGISLMKAAITWRQALLTEPLQFDCKKFQRILWLLPPFYVYFVSTESSYIM